MSNDKIYDRHLRRTAALVHSLENKTRMTIWELVFVLLFAFNLALGGVLNYGPNYFNNKRSLANLIFVKKGWAWTTAVVFAFYAILLSQRRTSLQNFIRFLGRYAIVTLWWVLFTQWCFGMPLMDWVFIATGGKCANIVKANLDKHSWLLEEGRETFETTMLSSAACRKVKGTWSGGHDPLGHVFLLVHSSLFLFFEIVQFQGCLARHRSIIENVRTAPHLIVVPLLGLWWFMLLVTNMYFHLFAEKVVGLGAGYLVLAVYYLPRWLR